ncbi:PH domain-containing protein [Bailinhaonella thermotolerans]|uniref:PH domain-containing protein n=1 Tax=Bailinhaonella thermotolerans TaxID=1070861 RepID=A0A3A4A2R0_9ACTN|nr:PH domain-containing protein [Bailinhaonella thermotolerans]RJL23026.1 PH domain-containing protein [Bailinhaonella thermotolerans]
MQNLDSLRPPRHPVDPRAVRWWTAQALVWTVPPVLLLAAGALIFAPARPWLLAALAVVAIPSALYVAFMPRARYRVHRWEVTDDAVYTSAGWIWQRWRVVPMSRVQTVDTVRGPLQRAFGLSGLVVTTASSAGAVRVQGLDHRLGADLAEQLTEIAHAHPGDAT